MYKHMGTSYPSAFNAGSFHSRLSSLHYRLAVRAVGAHASDEAHPTVMLALGCAAPVHAASAPPPAACAAAFAAATRAAAARSCSQPSNQKALAGIQGCAPNTR